MKRSNIITITKDFWKEDREPLRGARAEIRAVKKSYPVGTKFLSMKKAQAELDISRWTLSKYIRDGLISAVPKMKGWQIPEVAIDEFREMLLARKRRSG